jgi:ectoine hydroxylase-related dioxygenase (phytanoyl-CoA dioxygenase family)
MYMVPGSHNWGDKIKQVEGMPSGADLPATFEGHDLNFVMCPVRKGQVHFHHPLTWHGSGTNHSNRPRRAIGIHFMTERCTYDDRGAHPMKPFVTVANGAKLEGEGFPQVLG